MFASFLREFWTFLRVRKKYWLLPVFIVMVLFGGLIVLTKGRRWHLSFTRCSEVAVRILGLSAFYHDSAAAFVEDGRVVAAAPGRAVHPQEVRRQLSAGAR